MDFDNIIRYYYYISGLSIITNQINILNMETNENKTIKIRTEIYESIGKIWEYWTKPEHIMKWNNASDDWHTPRAENNFKVGGKFLYRMEAKDGSLGFDFWGIYDIVVSQKQIEYTLGDDRKVKIIFTKKD